MDWRGAITVLQQACRNLPSWYTGTQKYKNLFSQVRLSNWKFLYVGSSINIMTGILTKEFIFLHCKFIKESTFYQVIVHLFNNAY